MQAVPIRFEDLERCEPGYYLGSLEILPDLFCHVELIELKRSASPNPQARNSSFQSRIDVWLVRNDTASPKLYRRGRKLYFLNVEVFAQ